MMKNRLNILSKHSVIDGLLSLFVFVLIIDPTDRLIGLKMPLFALLVGLLFTTYRYTRIAEVRPFFLFMFICATTSFISFFRDININVDFALSVYKGLLMGLILFWASKFKVLEKFYIPSIFVGLLVMFIYICSFLYPNIVAVIYTLTVAEDSPWPIIMSTRSFVGINIVSIFYKTSPLFLFVAAASLHRLFNHIGNNIWNLLMVATSLSTLFMSGTRMNMLSSVALFGFALILKLWRSRNGRLIAAVMSVCSFVIGVFIIIQLLNDNGETSLEIKATLAESFYNEVDKDPMMLVFGQGVGATFDSLGVRGEFAVQSELTYFDLIRWFGIPFLLLFMGIFIYPLYVIYKKRKLLCYSNEIMFAYVLYLFIAGTNPLLTSSTGMLALFVMYSYALNPHYEQKNINI